MKYLFFVYLLLLFAGCTSSEHNAQQKQAINYHDKNNKIKKSPISVSNPLLKSYSDFLDTLDKSNMDNSLIAVQQFRKTFATANNQLCDTALFIFNRYYKK